MPQKEPPTDIVESLRELRGQVSATRGEAMHPDTVAQAVKLGMMQAVADPAFWSAAQNAMQERARSEAGGWLLGGLKGMLSKAFWFAVVSVIIYNAGGWALLATWFKGQHP